MASRAASSCGSLQQFSRKKREFQLLRVQQFPLKSCKGSRLCPGRDHRLVKRDLSELPFTSIRIWGFGPRFRYHPSIHPNLQLRTKETTRQRVSSIYHKNSRRTSSEINRNRKYSIPLPIFISSLCWSIFLIEHDRSPTWPRIVRHRYIPLRIHPDPSPDKRIFDVNKEHRAVEYHCCRSRVALNRRNSRERGKYSFERVFPSLSTGWMFLGGC